MAPATRAGLGMILSSALLCACQHQARPASPPAAPRPGETIVTVNNNNAGDMAVYVVNTLGGRWRLGTVMRTSTTRLSIPPRMLSEWGVQLAVVPVGGGTELRFSCTTIKRGSRIDLMLEANLNTSDCWNR